MTGHPCAMNLLTEWNNMKCPICSTDQAHCFARYSDFQVDECGGCGFRFVDPQGAGYPQDAQYVYDEPQLGTVNPRQPHIQRRIRDILRYAGSEQRRSLDIGCGKGEVALALRERGFHSAGIDMKPHVIAQLQQRYPDVQWQCAMTTELAGLPDRYDVLTMYHVLEHIPDPRSALQTVRALASPGALIVVEVPNVGGLKARLLGRRWGYYKVDHVNYFRPQDLVALGRQLGFELAGLRGYQHFSYPQDVVWKDLLKAGLAGIGFRDVISAFFKVPDKACQ